MAENEIKNLEENNLIDEKELKNNAPENAQLVEEGQVSTSELRNVIDMDAILEEAKKNDLYSNMLEPCQKMGININAQLIAFFEEEITDISDIKTSIQRGMERIKNRINKDNPYLVFDDSGNIDSDGIKNKIGKGQVPEYLKEYVEQEKEQVESNDIERQRVIAEFTEKIRNDWFEETPDGKFKFNDEMQKKLDEVVKAVDEKLSEYNDGAENITVSDGSKIQYNKKFSKGFNQRVALIKELESFLKPGMKFTNAPVDFILEVLPRYRELYEDACDDLTLEERAFFKDVLATFKERADIALNLDVSVFEMNEGSKEFLNGRFGISEPALKVAREKYVKDVKNPLMIKYDYYQNNNELKEFVIEQQELAEQTKLDLEKAQRIEQIQIAIARIQSLENDADSLVGRDKDERKEWAERAYERIKEANPKYYQEAKDTFKQRENIDVYAETLKDYLIRERLANLDLNNHKLTDLGKDGVKFYLVVVARTGLDSKDSVTRNKCIDFLVEQFPEIKDKYDFNTLREGDPTSIETLKYNLFGMSCSKFGHLDQIKKMHDYYDFDIYGRQTISNYVNGIFVGMAVGDKHNRDMHTAIIKSEEFKHDVHEKITNQYKDFKERKLFQTFINEIEDLKYKREFSDEGLTQEETIELIRSTICAVTMFEISNNKYEKKYAENLKEILVDYLPESFDLNGVLDEDRLESVYNTYLISTGYYNKIDDFSIDNKFDDITDKVNEEIRMFELGENPLKHFEEEKKIITQRNMRASSTEVNLESLKFVKYLKDRLPDSEYSEDMLKILEKIEEKNKSCINSQLSVLEKQKDRPENADLEKFKENIYIRVSRIDQGKFDDDKYFTLIKEGKRFIAEHKLNNYETQFANKDRIIDLEEQKEILSLYLGIKEDFSEAITKKDIYAKYDEMFKGYFKKISPDLLTVDGKINDKVLLEKYNELFGKNELSLKNAYKQNENKLLYEFLQEYSAQTVSGWNNRTIKVDLVNDFLVNKDNFIDGKVNMKLGKSSLENSLKLFSDMYAGIAKQMRFDFTKEDEVSLVKNLTMVLTVLENTNLDRQYLNDKETKLKESQSKILETARKSIKNMFRNIENEDGSIDLEKLNIVVKQYLDENEPGYTDGYEPEELVGKMFEEVKEIESKKIGPKQRKSSEEEELGKLLKVVDLLETESKVTIENEQTAFVYMRNVLKKTADDLGKKTSFHVIEKKFREKISFVEPEILSKVEGLVVPDDLTAKLQIIAATKYMERYENGINTFSQSMVDAGVLSERNEKMKNLLITKGIIDLCEKNPEGNENILARAKAIFTELIPDGIVDGKVDETALMEEAMRLQPIRFSDKGIDDFNSIANKKMSAYMIHTFVEDNIDRRYINVINEARENQKINEQSGLVIAQDEIESIVEAFGEELKVVAPGERLAEEIADAEAEVPEISDDEVRDVIEGRGEDMTVSEPVAQEKDKQIADDEVKPTFEKNSEDIHMAEPGIEEVIEDVVGEPKTAQTMVAEDMNVGENEEEKSLVVKNESPIKAMFEKARKTIKDVLENVASKFGFGTSSNSDTSNNDTTSSGASSSGTEKTVQDTGVKGLTGYDQIQLVSPIEQEKNEGTGENKTEKATRESDDPERG